MPDLSDPEMPDPYDEPVFVQGHMHAEPICAWPDCQTYLTREQMQVAHDLAKKPAPTYERVYYGAQDRSADVDPYEAARGQTAYERGIYGD
jgi:hypothetical protein